MVRVSAPPAGGSFISRRLLGVALLTVAPAVAVLAAMALWPIWHWDVVLAASTALLSASFFTIGAVLLAEPGQGGPGMALVASAGLLLVSWANEWNIGPLPLLSTLLGNYWLLTGGWALYRYPEPRLDPSDRAFFRLMLAWFTVVPILLVVTSRPEWHKFPVGVLWIPIAANHRAFRFVDRSNQLGLVAIGIVYICRWVARLRSARPIERQVKAPPALAAVAAAGAAAAVPLGQALGLSEAAQNVLYTIESASIVTVPAAFLVTVVRRHLARGRVADLVLGISGPPSTALVLTALREAMADPDLTIAYWSEDHGAYLDDTGQPVPFEDEDRRLATHVDSSTGEPLALILADRALIRDPELLLAASSIAGLALEVAHLLETVQSQLADLRDVSSRLVQATDAERRRLEADLHDGAQAQLLALGPMLGAAEATTSDLGTAAELAVIRRELTTGLRQLREFARGMHRSSRGDELPAAVRDACRPHTFEAEIELPDAALPETIAQAAYLGICESIANVAKHAAASKISITGTVRSNWFEVEVADDGRGGAVSSEGRGLRNIQDRVIALGGNVQVISPIGKGTRVIMRIPCA